MENQVCLYSEKIEIIRPSVTKIELRKSRTPGQIEMFGILKACDVVQKPFS
jgi:hypothetical protein